MTITAEIVQEREEELMQLAYQVMETAYVKELFVELPGHAYTSLYVGRRKRKKQWKIGFSDKPIQRAKSINSVLKNNGHTPDFELQYHIRGRRDVITAKEHAIKQQFKPLLVMATEWFSVDIEPAYQAAALEIAELWRDELRLWCSEDAVRVAYSSAAIFNLFSGSTLEMKHTLLDMAIRDWKKREVEVNSIPDRIADV